MNVTRACLRFESQGRFHIKAQGCASKSRNSPFIGQTLRGKVMYTLCNGRVFYSAV